MAHSFVHLLLAGGLLAGAIVFIVIVRNRVIRRRLLFAAIVSVGMVGVHFAANVTGRWWPTGFLALHGWPIEQLIAVVALSSALIALTFNPWFRDGESDRAPSIVQDSFVVVIGIVAGVFLFHVSSFSFLTGSAIVAALIGFALQETLANAFAGMALQMERPFRVGHWISVGDRIGLVTEMSWRATKIRTKAGNVVAVPNSVMAREAINNYSEPTSPTRLEVDVGVAYGHPPNEVRAALLASVDGTPYVTMNPAPDTMLVEFGASSITYRLWFWVSDFSLDDQAMNAVRTRIYYELKRRNIEIPFPIQVEYGREEVPVDREAERARFVASLSRVPVLASLPDEARRALGAESRELMFADGEMIVREGDPGASMFLVVSGTVVVTLGPERRQVAITPAGGYFGEMSLLTGEARSATVAARGDATVLEINAAAFRAYVQQRPEVIDVLAAAASERRRELDQARSAGGATRAGSQASLAARMRQYFGLH